MVIIIPRFHTTCTYYCKASYDETDETKEYYNKCYYEKIPLNKTIEFRGLFFPQIIFRFIINPKQHYKQHH